VLIYYILLFISHYISLYLIFTPLATFLCPTYEDDVNSQFGSSSFSVSILDSSNSNNDRSGESLLSGSGTHGLVVPGEFVYISDFTREDNTPGSVDLVYITFNVNEKSTATFYLLDSQMGDVSPSDGVRYTFICYDILLLCA
jgi:hypothetical protein